MNDGLSASALREGTANAGVPAKRMWRVTGVISFHCTAKDAEDSEDSNDSKEYHGSGSLESFESLYPLNLFYASSSRNARIGNPPTHCTGAA